MCYSYDCEYLAITLSGEGLLLLPHGRKKRGGERSEEKESHEMSHFHGCLTAPSNDISVRRAKICVCVWWGGVIHSANSSNLYSKIIHVDVHRVGLPSVPPYPVGNFHSGRFFPRTITLWNRLPRRCFPEPYNHNLFTSRINHYLSAIS